jgi:hypothetical protein
MIEFLKEKHPVDAEGIQTLNEVLNLKKKKVEVNESLNDDYYAAKEKREKETLNKLPGKPRLQDKYKEYPIQIDGNGEWECPTLKLFHKKSSEDLKKAIDKKISKPGGDLRYNKAGVKL